MLENNPERLSPIGKQGDDIPFATLFTGMLLITTYYWCTNQAIVQRTFASKSLAEGQKGVLFAAGMKLLGPVYLVLPGIIAWHLFGVVTDGNNKMVVKSVIEESGIAIEIEGEKGFEVIQDEEDIKTRLGISETISLEAIKGKKFKTNDEDNKTLTVTHLLNKGDLVACLLYTSPSPRDQRGSGIRWC